MSAGDGKRRGAGKADRFAVGPFGLGSAGLTAALVGLVALPPFALVLSVRPADFGRAAGLYEALSLSLGTTAITVGLLLVLGVPTAWVLSRRDDALGRGLELAMQLPAVTPPAVAGVALLAAFGRSAPWADLLVAWNVQIPFTRSAVVLAQLFVASPFFVLPLAEAFREIDAELLWTARSLGATPGRVFLRVALPLVGPTLIASLAMAWARALGEFGATLMFAGNLEGVTRTLPIAIYGAMESDLGAARALAIVLMAVALAVFLALKGLGARWRARRTA
ncbi:MAG: molybdate ABC transporter permease subunit [Sandaracinaceae bacterium]